MRHRKSGIKLGRTTSHRQAMFRNMVTSLFKYERIRTTDIKAKELRRWADHIITLAKVGDLHARRQVLSIMREKNVVHKLFEEAEKRFGQINGGYTRIVKIGTRPGDSAPISLIELVSTEEQTKKTKKKAKSTSKEKSQQTAPPTHAKEDAAREKSKEESTASATSTEPIDSAPEPKDAADQADSAASDPVETASEDVQASDQDAVEDSPLKTEEEVSRKQAKKQD